jgi:hypothetical protein
VGLSSLRRFDIQASYAYVLSIFSVFPLVGGAYLAWRNYNQDLGQILYQSKAYVAAFAGCVLISIAAGGLGCLLGFNSAGQRRNDKPLRSWVGFFVGGGVLTFDVILLIAFLMLRFRPPT